jgi:hypothetical protein
VVCAKHLRTPAGVEAVEAVRRATQNAVRAAGASPERLAAELGEEGERFRRRWQRGDYAGLLEEPLRRVLAQAAEAKGFRDEIGVMRFLLMKIVSDEEAAPLYAALAVSKLVNATVRAVGAQEASAGATAQMEELIERLRVEIEGE